MFKKYNYFFLYTFIYTIIYSLGKLTSFLFININNVNNN